MRGFRNKLFTEMFPGRTEVPKTLIFELPPLEASSVGPAVTVVTFLADIRTEEVSAGVCARRPVLHPNYSFDLRRKC